MMAVQSLPKASAPRGFALFPSRSGFGLGFPRGSCSSGRSRGCEWHVGTPREAYRAPEAFTNLAPRKQALIHKETCSFHWLEST